MSRLSVARQIHTICIMLVFLPSLTYASATLISDNRKVSAKLVVRDPCTDFFWSPDPITSTGDRHFDHSLNSGSFISGCGSETYAVSTQDSVISDGKEANRNIVFSSLLASGAAYSDYLVFNEEYNVYTHAKTEFTLAFNISESQEYRFTGVLSAKELLSETSFGASVHAQLIRLGTSPTYLEYFEGNSTIDESGILLPGDYKISIVAETFLSMDTHGPGFFRPQASFENIDFSLVPEPCTLTMAVILSAIVLRRKNI